MPPQATNTEAANTALQNKTQMMFMKSPRRSRKEPPKQKWVTPNRRLRGRIFKPSELIQKRQRKYVAWKRLNQFRRFVSCVCMTHAVSMQDDFLSAVADKYRSPSRDRPVSCRESVIRSRASRNPFSINLCNRECNVVAIAEAGMSRPKSFCGPIRKP